MQWSCAHEVICSSVTTRDKSTKKEYFFLAFERCLHAPCLWKCHSISSFPQISYEKLRLDEEQSKSCVCPAWRRAFFLVFLLEHVWIPLFYFAWMLLGADNPTFLPSHCWIDPVILIEAIKNWAVPARVTRDYWASERLRLQQLVLSHEKEKFTFKNVNK